MWARYPSPALYNKYMPYKDKDVQREYARLWMQNRRQAWLLAHGPCQGCGSHLDLEVDHIDPEKKISHRVWSWTDARREKELCKCRVLCKACHLRRTSEYRSSKVKHGTDAMYKARGCRCTTCREWKKNENAKRSVFGWGRSKRPT